MTLAAKTFLFRLDGAQENDAFLDLARSKGHVVYAGLVMTLERGWVPDFVEAVIDDDGGSSITLVELEATANMAVIGARKYLPESSKSILLAFISISNAFFSAAARPPTREPTTFRVSATPWTAAHPSECGLRLRFVDRRRWLRDSRSSTKELT